MTDQWGAFDLVEAFQLAHAVATLHDLGILTTLKKSATADELARRHSLDAKLLRGTLEFVAARTELLRKSGERFVATRDYSGGSRFLLDLYVGAYGGNAAQLGKLLSDASAASAAVNRLKHSRAFEAVDGLALGPLPDLIRQLEFNDLLDIGCGNGALLIELASKDSSFRGWGIDFNESMCRLARARVRTAGIGKRVRVINGDCQNLKDHLPAKTTKLIGSVSACNVVNEMFADGHAAVISWLRGLRRLFPGRLLLLVDYYGRLGKGKGKADRETLLHDYAQLISGQGVPPARRKEWQSIYERAGCRLVHVIEDTATTRFIHILGL